MVVGTTVSVPWQCQFWNYEIRDGMRVPLETATRLVGMFKKNFKKYEPNVTADVANVM